MENQIEISQYIATKLCHDLAGTLGAINSGLDFISSDNNDMRDKALNLIKSSSEQSVNRLIFFRQTYGVAKDPGECNLDEIKKTASDYFLSSKVKLDFHEKYFHVKDVYISANVGKLLLCLVHHAYLALIHGGEVKVVIDNNDGKQRIIISAIGTSPKIDNEKIDILNGKISNHILSTANCISFFARNFSEYLKVSIETDTSNQDNIDYIINL